MGATYILLLIEGINQRTSPQNKGWHRYLLLCKHHTARLLHRYTIAEWIELSVFPNVTVSSCRRYELRKCAVVSRKATLYFLGLKSLQLGRSENRSKGRVAMETEGWWFGREVRRNPMTDWLMLPCLLVPRWCKLKRQKEDSIIIICILFPQLQLDESPGAQRGSLPQNNNITRTSAVAMKVRKVRSVVGCTTDDASLWADGSLDSDLMKAYDLTVSLGGGEQMWSLSFVITSLCSGLLCRAGKIVVGNDCLPVAYSSLLLNISNRYGSRSQQPVDE